ncbi:hypothetical protein BH20ACT2_BH20ACT2_00510 [soil metagenome]
MDFELSDDQVALRAGIAALAAGRFDRDTVHALEAVPGAVDRDRWRGLGAAGVFSLTLGEADGGVGLGVADGAIVFEQLGRALVPGPLTWSLLAAGAVAGAGDGSVVVGGVVVGGARRRDGPILIEHLDGLDVVVVLDAAGLWRYQAASLRSAARPVERPLDPLSPVHLLGDLGAGEQLGGPDVTRRWQLVGTVLTAALQLGVAAGATDLAVAYAKERHQFGRPIGSFQAIKHLAADMVTRVEVARSAVYAAGVCIDDPSVGDPARAASVAKLVAGDAATANGKSCVQVHGGMGYTWEVDAHRFLKRAWVLDTAFGAPDDHAEAMAALLG